VKNNQDILIFIEVLAISHCYYRYNDNLRKTIKKLFFVNRV